MARKDVRDLASGEPRAKGEAEHGQELAAAPGGALHHRHRNQAGDLVVGVGGEVGAAAELLGGRLVDRLGCSDHRRLERLIAELCGERLVCGGQPRLEPALVDVRLQHSLTLRAITGGDGSGVPGEI